MDVARVLAPVSACVHYKEVGIERIDTRMGLLICGREPGRGLVPAREAFDYVISHTAYAPAILLEQWPPWLGEIGATVVTEAAWARVGVDLLQQWRRDVSRPIKGVT